MNTDITNFSSVDIYDRLRIKYPAYLKDEIIAVRVIQSSCNVWLEVTSTTPDSHLIGQSVNRLALDFITIDDEPMFNVSDTVIINANRLIDEYDPYSIIMTMDLFKEEVSLMIDSVHNQK